MEHHSVVKWFDNKKGYGFIVNPDGGSDIFVHYSAINSDRRFKTLKTGQVVHYQLNDGPKGLHAQNVSFEGDGAEEQALIGQDGSTTSTAQYDPLAAQSTDGAALLLSDPDKVVTSAGLLPTTTTAS